MSVFRFDVGAGPVSPGRPTGGLMRDPAVRRAVYVLGFVVAVWAGSVILPERVLFGLLVLILAGMVVARWDEMRTLFAV